MAWSPKTSGAEPFNRQMRKATRDVHAISDALVNGKLALALSDNSVWAEGLLVFYEIFRFLEEALERHRDGPLGELRVEGIERTEAFQKDLKFYLGDDWASSYTPRECVANYLQHLMEIERKDPDLLIAYVYHMYMGLLSGGQILRKKRQMTSYLPIIGSTNKPKGGNAVTDFRGYSIYQLKKEVVAALNSVAMRLDTEKKRQILEESRTVFELNNTLVRSVRGAGQVLLRKILSLFFCLLLVYAVIKMLKKLYW